VVGFADVREQLLAAARKWRVLAEKAAAGQSPGESTEA
jgi:hypothetical protein